MPTTSLLLRSYAAAATTTASSRGSLSSSGSSGTPPAADEGRAVAHVRRREGGPLRVLISGATVGGLTLAHCLRARGIQAEVVEADSNYDRFVGRSAVVSGDALRVLQGLGLRSVLEREGTVLAKAVTGLYSGKSIHQQNFEPPTQDQGAGAVAIPAFALAELLAESWESRGGRINTSTAILTMREVAGTGVRCSFRDAKMGSRDYDLIVLADGVNSGNTPEVLKEEIYQNPYMTATQVGAYGVWSTYLPRPFTIAPDQAVDVLGLGSRAGYVPMPEDLLYFWATHRADMAPFLKGGAREAREWPSVGGGFEKGFSMRTVVQQVEQSDRTCWVHYPRDMRIKQWTHRAGRVALLGSGAYSTAPLPLHEAALPIEDAAVLAHALATHPLPADALAAYAARRKPRVEAAQDWAWYLHTQATKTGRWQLALRNFWLTAGPGRLTFARRSSALARPLSSSSS
ncbi:FAD binding domain containing protein [Acanthamoeba castellanii str. Neff]|uniref:FAD binding domain containing protein n=1 Tax=Acanthamoeba castellanii (strain ATCC 30010 / Neff) TaxID=1257118 RepID=L8HHE4_ACACF|nr:FAD binding domain containing protein [Acanthamoeba castellanii str. Neff]ELR25009.1 FAD binding domain containing protein [Acanthamoeba castellanii str. Neff]